MVEYNTIVPYSLLVIIFKILKILFKSDWGSLLTNHLVAGRQAKYNSA